jgi:ubiquinone/menaquinone biosynthesis C-methylase UbiE
MTGAAGSPSRPAPQEAKSCCAAAYSSDWARLLLGPETSFHPGGLALTERLGTLLTLGPEAHVLDVAGGPGASAIHLAGRFGCRVTVLDYSAASVATAQHAAGQAGVGDRVAAVQGDAERLPFADGSFDAVICECAYCTFPDKAAAAAEFARVLRPGGRLGLSDLTRAGPLPCALKGLLAWVACIADARPVAEYVAYLQGAGLTVEHVELHDEALRDLVQGIRTKLLGAQLLVSLKKIDEPAVDFAQAQRLARGVAEAVAAGTLGYALLVGTRRAS